MSSEVSAVAEGLWSGGGSPYRTNSKKFGMWLFIISDALTFSALLFAYTYSRVANPNWPTPFHFSPGIIFSSIMTFALLSSSLTMVMAVHSMNNGNRSATGKWILATIAGGALFVGLHLTEWIHLMTEEGIKPWGKADDPNFPPLFGGTFFTLTGLHMTHVVIGIIYLLIIWQAVIRNKFKAEDVEVAGLYWHFVDLVWMFIFPLVYLMSAKVG